LKKITLIGLSVLSGVLLSLAWTQWMSGLILLIAFIPLLFVEKYLYENRNKFHSFQMFKYAYLAFFVWNLISTWWIYYSTLFGVISAVLYNSLLMSLVFWIFHIVKCKMGQQYGFFGLIIFWLSFEFIHFNWELSWTWLNLGNGFAKNISLIQWYEYTGVLGGSFWVLISNISIYSLIINLRKRVIDRKVVFQIGLLIMIICVPIVFSQIIFHSYLEKTDSINVVVLQPNVDPYNEKFDGLSSKQQLEILLNLADSLGDENTDYFVAPETALANGMWESQLAKYKAIKTIKEFLKKYPKAKFITGITSYKKYEEGEKLSTTVRQSKGFDGYYDVFNTAIQLDSSEIIQKYHKSKLVPGVEKMPLPHIFKFIEKLALDLGGTTGSLGKQADRGTFYSVNDKTIIAPVICYESIFGEFVNGYIKNKANFIFVVTNDGWWGNTPGHRQHLTYSQLRAIETRRSIARSANTGISCFINQKGEVFQPTDYWVRTAIKGTINSNNTITYYVENGNYIGRIAAFFSVLILLIFLVDVFIRKKNNSVNSL